MGKSIIRDKLLEEIKLIPENELSEVYKFVHYLKTGLKKSKGDIDQIMKFAGCWKDMSEKAFNDFLQEIGQRRKHAFSRRRCSEAGNG